MTSFDSLSHDHVVCQVDTSNKCQMTELTIIVVSEARQAKVISTKTCCKVSKLKSAQGSWQPQRPFWCKSLGFVKTKKKFKIVY